MSDPFKHVVLLMLENHSFDQMLGCMTELYPHLEGVRPGAPNVNRDAEGREYSQQPHARLQMQPDPKHEALNTRAQLEDHNGGFIKDYLGFYAGKGRDQDKARAAAPDIMAYFPRGKLPALHALAEEFTICDHWFSSLPGPTWPNRFFALSGSSNGKVLMPDGFKQLGMLRSQTQDTIFDRLNAKPVSWRVYFYDFPCSLILRNQRAPKNLAHYRRMDQFFKDARGAESDFPGFTFLEPKYFGVAQNDDHPPHNVMKAQKLIADVYNAIRSNPALWETTLLAVVYDEHGGFYDHVEPPAAAPPYPPQDTDEYTFDRLGVRVPALLVSPHLRAGVVNTQLEHSSLLRFLIGKWSLEPLGERTKGKDDLGDNLPWVVSVRTDTIPFIRVPSSDLISKEPDWERQDVGVHHHGLHLMADVLDLPDQVTEVAVAKLAEAAAAVEHALPRLRAAMGDRLIAMGRALRKPLEDARQARIDKSDDVIRRAIPGASSEK